MITAFVLMEVPAKQSGALVEYLNKFSEIREASAVYGDTDVIAKITTETQDELDRMIMDVIQGNPDVRSTRTLVVVEKYHWTR